MTLEEELELALTHLRSARSEVAEIERQVRVLREQIKMKDGPVQYVSGPPPQTW